MLTMYVTPVCPHCIQAKKFLEYHKIKWKEVDVAKDKKAREYLFRNTGMVVGPTFAVNKKFLVGYDLSNKRKLIRELGLKH